MGFFVSEKNNKAVTPIVDEFTTSATDTYVMSKAETNEDQVLVYLGGVHQIPGAGNAYTVSGTDLVLASVPDTGLDLVVVHRAFST